MPLPVRQAVKVEAPALELTGWAQAKTLRVMGIDPGFASMGVSILEKEVGAEKPRALLLRPLETKKASKKVMRNLRVADDDERRYREFWAYLCELEAEYHPHVVAMENYNPFKRVGSSAWKTLRVCGMVMGWCLARPHVVFLSFNPQDLKRNIAGKLSASKEDVEAALPKKVDGFEALIAQQHKDDHEHLADATGHAYLAFAEIQKLRHLMGLGGVL